MPITPTEVEKIAALANLALTPDETQRFSVQLAAIVEYIDQLNEVDTASVKPWQPRSAGDALRSAATRDDQAAPGLGQARAVEQAPDADDGHFRAPRVIG
jgi:aspartyl-tRNA(Asn)/glutamyl-tRNA(Gln) amidotransferase subunit C